MSLPRDAEGFITAEALNELGYDFARQARAIPDDVDGSDELGLMECAEIAWDEGGRRR